MNEPEHNAFETSKFFGDRSSYRIIFLRKVYALLTFQLLVGLSYVAAAFESVQYHNWLLQYWQVAIAQGVVAVLLLLIVFFSRSSFRKRPVDVLTYLLFTQAVGHVLAYLAASTGNQILIMVVSLAVLLTFSLLIYALTTKFDLTYLGGTIYVIGSALFGFEIFLIASDLAFSQMIYVALAVIIFGFYLIYDTQFIIVGQSLNAEMENAFVGSIVVYMDVILIFFRLIQLLGRLFKKNRH
jgi:FtsH-binding integral membrane protein